ncbi:MAG: pentapeptide repeat-containing protein [Victivallaceae bacterium]|nr:pentapeptide repeat-containing protein [Victivallaceae bacterium]
MMVLGICFIFNKLGIFYILSAKECIDPVVISLFLWFFKKNAPKKNDSTEQELTPQGKKRLWENLAEVQNSEKRQQNIELQEEKRLKEKQPEGKKFKKRDIELQDKKKFWKNLIEVQETFIYENSTDTQKTEAIYKVSKFYATQHIDLAAHIHSLFKEFLENFWKHNPDFKNVSRLPVYIEVIYHVIKHQSHQKQDEINLFNKKNSLSFADFQLQFANLNYGNFFSANLINTNLAASNLTNANLSKADFTNANLTNADLTSADLTDSNLTDTFLINANLTDANINRANLKNTTSPNANLTNVNLTRADLSYGNFSNANLTSANLIRANLTNTNLTGANLTDANLIGANLIHTDLSCTNLAGVNLSCAKLAHAKLLDANFARVNLVGVDLRMAMNLNIAKLKDALYCKSKDFMTKLPHGFKPKDYGMILVNELGERINE